MGVVECESTYPMTKSSLLTAILAIIVIRRCPLGYSVRDRRCWISSCGVTYCAPPISGMDRTSGDQHPTKPLGVSSEPHSTKCEDMGESARGAFKDRCSRDINICGRRGLPYIYDRMNTGSYLHEQIALSGGLMQSECRQTILQPFWFSARLSGVGTSTRVPFSGCSSEHISLSKRTATLCPTVRRCDQPDADRTARSSRYLLL